ncbi:MAG: hypothetical protein WD757_08190 [Actinomycetota bacterium]
MSGPAGVMALVLAETVAGGAALLFLTPLWSEVRRGFFKVTGSVLLVLAVSTWGSISFGYQGGSAAGRLALWLSLALWILTLAWVGLLFAGADKLARAIGFCSVPLSMALLVALAGTAGDSAVIGFLQLAAGAAFLGAVLDGLLLGHWYLTDRGLSRGPINRFTSFLLVAVVLEAAAVAAGGFGPAADSTNTSFNPILTAFGMAQWIALGMVAATALIAVMIRLTLRGERASAVQSATGFFYLAVITAFAGELATKVKFLGGG